MINKTLFIIEVCAQKLRSGEKQVSSFAVLPDLEYVGASYQ